MSASYAEEPDAPRRHFALLRRLSERTPLRVKLVVSVLVLVAVGLLIAGTAASTALHSYMVQRVDQQLQFGPLRQGGPTVIGGPQLPASAAATLANGVCSTDEPFGFRRPTNRYVRCTTLAGATVTADVLQTGTSEPALPHWTGTQVAARHGDPFTVASAGSGPAWRVRVAVVGNRVIYEANSLEDVDHTVGRLERDELEIGLTVLVLIAALGYWLVRRSLRPLTDVEQVAADIAAGDLSRRVPHRDPRTEVGRLASSINTMLSQIESAFRTRRDSEEAALASEQRMRRFVTDASHELRTPLTSIRGFAELYRQGAAGNPGDLARLMRRIEDEAARMGLLVDDLLLLARLDQQRPLEREVVDLVRLAADAVHDAAAVAPDRTISLEVSPDSAPEVIGDEHRLRQVVANLVSNALTHTPAGSPVTVRLGNRVLDDEAWALLEVSDRGPGLDDEASQRVFERFYRADPSRTRALGGSGLGLSIVAALVAAHGGRVELESTPGEGATFRVLLPALPVDAPAVEASVAPRTALKSAAPELT